MIRRLMIYLPAILVSFILTQNTANIPGSDRSREVIQRVSPRLEVEFAARDLGLGAPVFIRILKDIKELEVWVESGESFKLFKTYSICTYSKGLGPKKKEGDHKSPEGFYFVPPGNLNPDSKYHLSFNIGYPNRYDRTHGYTGAALMVHGRCVSIGCYAMGDKNIEEIYTIIHRAFEGGQPWFRIHIFPYRMTNDNMEKYATETRLFSSELKYADYLEFWDNLKEGYDFFEEHGYPPNVEVRDGRYVFN